MTEVEIIDLNLDEGTATVKCANGLIYKYKKHWKKTWGAKKETCFNCALKGKKRACEWKTEGFGPNITKKRLCSECMVEFGLMSMEEVNVIKTMVLIC